MRHEAFFLGVLECMQEQVYIRDLDKNIIYINPAAERLTGYTLDEALTRKCFEVFGDENQTCKDTCPIEKAIAENQHLQHHEGDLKTRRGEFRRMRVSISPLYKNNVISGATVVMQDITTFKNLEITQLKTTIALKKEVDARKQSESNLKKAQSVAGVGSWHIDISTGALTWSDETYRMFGVEKGTQVDVDVFFDHVHPDDHAIVKSAWQAALNGAPYELEHRIIVENHEHWVHEKAEVFFDDKGTPIDAVGTVLDITNKHLLETMLRIERDMATQWNRASSLKERLEVCLDTAISTSDMDSGGIFLTNGSIDLAVHRNLPDTFIESLAHCSTDHLFKSETPSFRGNLKRLREAGIAIDADHFRSSAIIPMKYREEVIAGLIVASRKHQHISNHAETALERVARYAGSFVAQEIQEEKSRQSRRNMEILIDTMDDMLFIVDLNHTIVNVNSVVSRRLGYSKPELIGNKIQSVHSENQHDALMTQIEGVLAGQIYTCHIPLLTRSMQQIPVETKVKLGQWDGKEVIICVSRDISERQRLEQKRIYLEKKHQQVEKAESLSRMAKAVAHNFNNTLSGVIGNLDMAMTEVSPKTDVYKYLSDANSAAKSTAETVQLISTYIGDAYSPKEPVDLATICHEHLIQFHAALVEHATITTDLPDNALVVEANPEQLFQLLNNLIVNAIEATSPVHRQIDIRLETRTQLSTDSKTHFFPEDWAPPTSRFACLSITDNGCGIEEKDIDKIFDPFYSDKFPGRGLGLAVSLGVVKGLNGRIAVKSNTQKGSCFEVLLPLA